MRIIAAITMPALLGMIVVAPDFVDVVLGDKWSEAVPVIRLLAFVALLQSLQTMNADILQALDRAGTMLRFMIVWFVANLTAFVIGLQWGIVGVAAGYAVAATVLEPANAWLTARALDTPLRAVARGLAGVVQAGLAMAVVAALVRQAALELGLSPLLRLVVVTLVGAAVYMPLCLWRSPEARNDVRGLLRQRRSRAVAAVEPQLP
jgi:O-antigen/teichoic acid export membrane protein